MKHFWKWLLPLLLVGGIALWLVPRLRLEVAVGEVRRGTAVNAVTGTVEVFAVMDLVFKTERHGRLTEVPVQVGQVVVEGAPLAVQSSAQLDLRIAAVELRLEKARASRALRNPREFDIETIEREVESLKLAVELNQAPRSRLEQMERELEKQRNVLEAERLAQAEQLALLENELAQLRLEQDLLTVRAGFDGVVTEIFRFPGDLIGPGVDIARVIAPGRFAEMTLNEEDFFGVDLGQRVTVRLAGFPDRQFEARVSFLGAVADAAEKVRRVTLEIDDPEGLLVPGLTGEGLLYKDVREGTLLVPRRALIGHRVWVVEEGRVALREVGRGFVGLDRAEILSGLAEGETVILENQSLLREGMRVRTRPGR